MREGHCLPPRSSFLNSEQCGAKFWRVFVRRKQWHTNLNNALVEDHDGK
jgi:hypothetical protein